MQNVNQIERKLLRLRGWDHSPDTSLVKYLVSQGAAHTIHNIKHVYIYIYSRAIKNEHKLHQDL